MAASMRSGGYRGLRAASIAALVLTGALTGCETPPGGGAPVPSRPVGVEPPAEAVLPRPVSAAPVTIRSAPPGTETGTATRSALLGGPGRLVEDFEVRTGTWPRFWKDVRPEAAPGVWPWLQSGLWAVAPTLVPGMRGLALEFRDLRPQPVLTFRRWAGQAFGTPDGQLPGRYRVTLTVLPIEARADFFPPTGDLGVPVYYVDPVHYVELLVKPDRFQIWECQGGEPQKWRGWRMLHEEDATFSARVPIRMSAEIDSWRGSIRCTSPAAAPVEVQSTVISPTAHHVALRAASSRVQFDDLVIESLSDDGAPEASPSAG